MTFLEGRSGDGTFFSGDSFDPPRYTILSSVHRQGFVFFLLHLFQKVLVLPPRQCWIFLAKARVANFMSMTLAYTVLFLL